jgi:UDP-glucose 4-epimerase
MASSNHIIVTGGAGFIGSHLVERLLADGKSVVVIDDLSTGSWANLKAVATHRQLRVIEERVSSCSQLPALMQDAEFVYHLAAAVGVELVLKSPIRTIQTNLYETEAVLEAASVHGVPVLLTSTSEVYGKSQKECFSEEDDLLIGPPTQARWSYACSKLMDEFVAMAFAREKNLPVIITRHFNTVGPRQTGEYGMVLPRFIAAAKAGRSLRVFGDGIQTRCFCDVQDVVEGMVRLQNCPTARCEVFNIGGTQEISMRGLAERVVRVLHSPSSIEFVPYAQAYGSDFEDMPRRRPNTEKLEKRTGFKPRSELETIIKRIAGGAE